MHDKVSVVDRFRFWFSFRNSFQGPKSIVMQTSIAFGPIFGRRERTSWGGGGGAPHLKCEFIIIIYKSVSARIIEPR